MSFDPSHPGEFEPSQLVDDETASTCSASDSDDALARPIDSLRAAEVPSFDEVLPSFDPVAMKAVPSVLSALNRVATDVQEMNVRVIDYYAELRSVSPLLSSAVAPRAHVDGGSIATTTDRLDYLFCYHRFNAEELRRAVRLRVADDTIHVPTGVGYLKIPRRRGQGFLYTKSYYTPQIPATILSPDSAAKSLGCTGYSTFSDLVDDTASLQLIDCSQCDCTVDFDLRLIRGLLFTDSLIAPTESKRLSSTLPDDPADIVAASVAPSAASTNDVPVRVLSGDQQRALWHCRLGHTHARAVADLHKYVDGIPKLPRDDPLSSCPLCKKAKLHKADRGPPEDATPTECWQDIQIDMGFMVQTSNPKSKSNIEATSSSAPRTSRRARQTTATLRALESAPRRSSRTNRFTGSYSERPSGHRPSPPAADARPSPSPGQPALSPAAPEDGSPSPFRPAPSSATYQFEKIVAHQGPISRTDKRYKGEPFNLKILWSTRQTTWEPLSVFFEDQPDEVAAYARQNNLLDNAHWSAVRDYTLDPARTAPFDAAFHEEFDFAPDTAEPLEASLADKPQRYKRALGLYGETCYVLISDRKSGSLKVSIRRDKTPPFDFLKSFIANYKPNASNCRVRFDGGGELGGNKEIHNLFEAAGYEVEVTAPDSSSSIGLAERPHRTIASAVRTMLYSAGLPLKYWPFALQYFVLIHNCLPHGSRPESAYTMCTGKRFNVSLLRVFGCRLYSLPRKSRDAKLDVHTRSGIFLGYRKSMGNALYIDSASGKVKQTRHMAFDEGMNDSADPPPYVQYLKNPDSSLELVDLDEVEPLDVSLSPFSHVDDVPCTFRPQDEHSLGVQFGSCPRYGRAYAADFLRPFGPHEVSAARRKFIGGYITKLGDFPVFSTDDVARVLHEYAHRPVPPASLLVRISRDLRFDLVDTRPPTLHLRPVDIRRIAAMKLVAGEGMSISQRRAHLRSLAATPLLSASPADPDDLVPHSAADLLEMRKLSNDHMTEEEKALPSFTRRRLMQLPNWHEWQAADDKQLDSHFDAGTIGMAVPRPKKDPSKPSQVFRLHWARLVKASGVRKSRACLDGSKRAAPWLRMMVQTYSSCVELPCLRAFIAICVNRGFYICFGDVENAYQQSPPPSIDCYLEVDDTVADWYERRFGIKLDRMKEVIPLYRALQGHPEAGVLWERMITDILINKMGFRNTTHEKNLYTGSIDGQEILVCRQVDDFAAGAATREAAERFMDIIRSHVKAEFAGMGIETSEGVLQRFNGIDVFQTRDYVKLSAESYIDRMLQTHGWEEDKRSRRDPRPADQQKAVPLNPAIANRLMTLEGPSEKTVEANMLAKENGFSYRNLLGELIYAYVICRLDIGYAVCFLARFSESPHEEHYKALKGVCRYLRATKAWGLMYQRPAPLSDLPAVPFDWMEEDPTLPPFPTFTRDELVGLLDAAHATELRTRRSVTGFVLLYCFAAIAWKSRVQPLVATSSTEAEFYAAVTCAKAAKYLRYILQQLDALRPGATKLLVDNQAAIAMVNESRPTPRARHIEIQHFAIQEWRNQGDIVLDHCPGVINSSDDLTKPLGWVLHSRHARRSMGHFRIGSSLGFESPSRPPMLEKGSSKPGRVLEPKPRPGPSDGLGHVGSRHVDAVTGHIDA